MKNEKILGLLEAIKDSGNIESVITYKNLTETIAELKEEISALNAKVEKADFIKICKKILKEAEKSKSATGYTVYGKDNFTLVCDGFRMAKISKNIEFAGQKAKCDLLKIWQNSEPYTILKRPVEIPSYKELKSIFDTEKEKAVATKNITASYFNKNTYFYFNNTAIKTEYLLDSVKATGETTAYIPHGIQKNDKNRYGILMKSNDVTFWTLPINFKCSCDSENFSIHFM